MPGYLIQDKEVHVPCHGEGPDVDIWVQTEDYTVHLNPDDAEKLAHKLLGVVQTVRKKEYAEAHPDPCPDCRTQLESGPGGGVRCPKKGCGYWFCF